MLKKVFFYLAFENSVIVGNNRNYLTSLSNWLKPVAKSVNSLWSAVGVHPWTAGLQVHFTPDVMARARL